MCCVFVRHYWATLRLFERINNDVSKEVSGHRDVHDVHDSSQDWDVCFNSSFIYLNLQIVLIK